MLLPMNKGAAICDVPYQLKIGNVSHILSASLLIGRSIQSAHRCVNHSAQRRLAA